MSFETIRVAVPVALLAWCVITLPSMRMFIGTVLGALGAIALLVAAAVHTDEAVPAALAGAGSLAVGVALVAWGYDRTPASEPGDDALVR